MAQRMVKRFQIIRCIFALKIVLTLFNCSILVTRRLKRILETFKEDLKKIPVVKIRKNDRIDSLCREYFCRAVAIQPSRILARRITVASERNVDMENMNCDPIEIESNVIRVEVVNGNEIAIAANNSNTSRNDNVEQQNVQLNDDIPCGERETKANDIPNIYSITVNKNTSNNANEIICDEEDFNLSYSGESETGSNITEAGELNSFGNNGITQQHPQNDRITSSAANAIASSAASCNSQETVQANRENIQHDRTMKPIPKLIPLEMPNLAKDPFGFVRYHRAKLQSILAERNTSE